MILELQIKRIGHMVTREYMIYIAWQSKKMNKFCVMKN